MGFQMFAVREVFSFHHPILLRRSFIAGLHCILALTEKYEMAPVATDAQVHYLT